jgi:AraC-like DNA-binding protein
VLHPRLLLDHDGLTLADVACRHRRGHAHDVEIADTYRIVLVRRGCFVRRADGDAAMLDPTLAFGVTPGTEQRYDHPAEGGDDCTSVTVAEDLLAELWGGDPALPAGPFGIGPELDLEHRLLLAAGASGADNGELFERALNLAAGVLHGVDARRVLAGRPATERRRRTIADEARQALVADPSCSQRALARALAVSPHHLSRLFAQHTGHTLSAHRRRLRVRAALERLYGGEHDLARLAAETGFADQSHLCRAVRHETTMTPAALRALLGDQSSGSMTATA